MQETSKDDRTWALVCHLAGFAGLTGIPFGNILGAAGGVAHQKRSILVCE